MRTRIYTVRFRPSYGPVSVPDDDFRVLSCIALYGHGCQLHRASRLEERESFQLVPSRSALQIRPFLTVYQSPSFTQFPSLLNSFGTKQRSKSSALSGETVPLGKILLLFPRNISRLYCRLSLQLFYFLQSMVELNSYLTQQGKVDDTRTAPSGSMESTIQEVHDDDILVSLSIRFLSSTALLLSLDVSCTIPLTCRNARLEKVACNRSIFFLGPQNALMDCVPF
jgi:hypothetical protein